MENLIPYGPGTAYDTQTGQYVNISTGQRYNRSEELGASLFQPIRAETLGDISEIPALFAVDYTGRTAPIPAQQQVSIGGVTFSAPMIEAIYRNYSRFVADEMVRAMVIQSGGNPTGLPAPLYAPETFARMQTDTQAYAASHPATRPGNGSTGNGSGAGGGTGNGVAGPSGNTVRDRVRRLAVEGGNPDRLSYDQWNYYYEKVSGSFAPAFEDVLPGRDRAESMTLDTWFSAVEAYGARRDRTETAAEETAGMSTKVMVGIGVVILILLFWR